MSDATSGGPTPLRVLYPGSFDPIHLGHVDIIEQACELFGSVVVAIMHNHAKPSGLFPVDERVELARVALAHLDGVTVTARTGLAVQAAAFAYAWEKCRRLPLVDAFIYHRHVDHAHEGGLRLGLWRNAPNSVSQPHSKKKIHELFQKAGTPAWDEAAAFALPVAELKSWDELRPK